MTTGSHIASSKPVPADAESSKDHEQQHATEEKKSVEWGQLLADVYPLIKIMEVQVCGIFMPLPCILWPPVCNIYIYITLFLTSPSICTCMYIRPASY